MGSSSNWNSRVATLVGGVSLLATVGWLRNNSSRRTLVHHPEGGALWYFWKLLQLPWKFMIKGQRAKVPLKDLSVTAMQEIQLLMDVVEQYMLPLAASGVCSGNPPDGAALIHRKTRKCLVSAASQVRQNPLLVPTLSAINAAADSLQAMGAGTGPVSLEEYVLVSTRPLCPLAQEAVAAARIKTVYILFPCDSFSVSFSATSPSAGAVRNSSRFSTVHVPDTIGKINMGMRSFENESQMHEAQRRDRDLARAQQRLLVLASVYARLEQEILPGAK